MTIGKGVAMYKKILVGIDGSPQSLRAAREAGEIARIMDADLYVVVAYEPIPTELGAPYQQVIVSERLMESDKIYEAALKECGAISGAIVKEILEGPPAEAILSVVDARRIDLIVMGTRGLGKIASIILGSQSYKVISQATCPVLLIR
jgi:nucleotide-binding universal stress UspA family protein